MTRFLIRRIGQAILVLWAASIAVFLLFFVGPGPNQVARTFAGRLGTPADTADLVAFLLSPRGRWVTGQLLASDGGFSISI